LGERPVGLKNERNGLLEVRSGLFKRRTLRIRARQFFDKPDVALGNFAKHRREFQIHFRSCSYDTPHRDLSEIYQRQQSLESAVEKLPYSTTSFFDPVSRKASVQRLAFQIDAIELTEGFLVAAYRQYLPAIRAATNGER